jgi:hypothetical protein
MPRNDFNGDGRSDILWRNDNGTISDWLGNASGGFIINDSFALRPAPLTWTVAGTGDFNGDGRADILWSNLAGQSDGDATYSVSNWLGTPTGGFIVNDAIALFEIPAMWSIAATGDFNGDGYDDILVTRGHIFSAGPGDARENEVWFGTNSGGFRLDDGTWRTFIFPDAWVVAGTGDFNGDGRDDILWRAGGSIALEWWLAGSTGGFVTNNADQQVSVWFDWNVIGIGDFNGDRRDDILWRNDNGTISNWLGTSEGKFIINDQNAWVSVPLEWHVHEIGDYNGDGRDDLLWRQTSGAVSDWLGTQSGGWTINDANALVGVSTNWMIQAVPLLANGGDWTYV